MQYSAHFRFTQSGEVCLQSVAEHCRNTGQNAAACLRGIGMEDVGYLAGLLHDMGKMTAAFQAYLEDGMSPHPSMRRADHGRDLGVCRGRASRPVRLPRCGAAERLSDQRGLE